MYQNTELFQNVHYAIKIHYMSFMPSFLLKMTLVDYTSLSHNVH